MRIYCINMARRPDRWANMQARFGALGLTAERVDAVTPAAVTDEQRRKFCDPMAFRWQTDGELCCSLSHQKACAMFLETGDRFGMIVEDDGILSQSLPRFIAELEAAQPDIDLLRIETDQSRLRVLRQPESMLGPFAVYRLFSAGGGSAGYVLSRRAAEQIAGGEEILSDLTDQSLFNPYSPLPRTLRMRQLDPGLLVQEDRIDKHGDRLALSDLELARRQRGQNDQRNFWRRMHHNIRDFIQRDVIMAARNLWLKHARGVVKYAILFRPD